MSRCSAPTTDINRKDIPMAIPTPDPRIARFERMGYDMFIHWGLYAHLSQGHCVQNLRTTRLFPSLSICTDSED